MCISIYTYQYTHINIHISIYTTSDFFCRTSDFFCRTSDFFCRSRSREPAIIAHSQTRFSAIETLLRLYRDSIESIGRRPLEKRRPIDRPIKEETPYNSGDPSTFTGSRIYPGDPGARSSTGSGHDKARRKPDPEPGAYPGRIQSTDGESRSHFRGVQRRQLEGSTERAAGTSGSRSHYLFKGKTSEKITHRLYIAHLQYQI